MTCTAFIATSLDGFIARRDGGIDWLASVETEGEDYGYAAFMATVEGMVMGRGTIETVVNFPEWPYGETPVTVLTSQPLAVPEKLQGKVSLLPPEPAVAVEHFRQRGFNHLYVDGGKTIQGFLEAGYLDRLIISRIPILLGDGLALFGALPHDVKLRHEETRSFASGLVQSRYAVMKTGQK
ncbi:dihydrofolate reductase family protein [Prosthecobacter dejongeii]|uniref:Dihydrofolate reductase n=1 Tax=Prosthecobacter dejongeii TaxID=48465 RepID=A0A7W8DRP0_9BACT|nr:dihydrofolate reductase family protein [Prosthecobacter dejongeii]MBB5040084.1 dihydrofolate reductase [Prosthecobacter dejongeii]